MQQNRQPTAATMGGLTTVDLGTGELLLPEVVKALVEYARKYDLDPVRDHVVLMYGKPYITLDGYLYHANRTGIDYTLKSWPLNDEERKQYKLGEEDHAWLAECIRKPSDTSHFGLGIVTKEEMTATSKKDTTKLRAPVVAAHPQLLAQKRAEWQGMRRAFPIGAEEPDQEEEIPIKEGDHES